MSRFHLGAALASPALVALALSAEIAAQCPVPDGLSGPCWQFAPAHLPSFPLIAQDGLGICWDQCAPIQQLCTRVVVQPPVQTQCGQYSAQIDVLDCAFGISLLKGVAVLDYTRTWLETAAVGGAITQYQVWRFAAKVDFGGAPAAAPACPVPSCIGPWPTAYFYGYVDYAFDCFTGAWEQSLVLYHACDWFIHQAPLSDRPGFFHPTRSYAVVAPHTAANPFAPVMSPPPGGPLVAEAVRDVAPLAGAALCLTEERILAGLHLPLISGCLCPLSLVPPQQTAVHFTGTGTCPDPSGVPSSFISIGTYFGIVPWFELIETSIGCWTTGASYPGKECAWVDEGLFSYRDSCVPVLTPPLPGKFIDIFYGATTQAGFPAMSIDPTTSITDNFIDVASNFAHPTGLGIPIAPPILGSVRKTDHLIYANVP